jgi:acetyl esterase/lipase
LWHGNTPAHPARGLLQASDETRGVLSYQRTDDSRWLLYTQDGSGDENWHIYRVDLDHPSAPAVDLTPFPGVRTCLALLADRPGKAMVGMNKRTPAFADAYELDIATGELTLVRLDVATGEETEVDDHPTLSIDPRGAGSPTLTPPLILSPRTGDLLGVRYLGERQLIHAMDPHFATVLENLAKLSSDDTGQHWVVNFTHDREPGHTFFYDHVGISSLENFMRMLPPVARPHLANNWHLFVGDPDVPEQRTDMLSRSPITRVDQIRTPLLVVQGANDVRVVQAESDNLVEALRVRGVDVEYMVKDDEGHGFVNSDNVIDMYRMVDRFLVEHLAVRRMEHTA